MTEDEAKTKWCPFSRVVGQPNSAEVAANRYPEDEDAKVGTTNTCVGSACMAWRWSKVANPDWGPPEHMMSYPARNPYAADPAHVFSSTEGHCGLADQP